MQLVFDVESNGLLAEATKIWCMVIQDVETGKQIEVVFDNTPTTTPKQAEQQRKNNCNQTALALSGM